MLLNNIELAFSDMAGYSLIGKPVASAQYERLITESSYVKLSNHKPIVYLTLDSQSFDELLPYLHALRFQKSTRKTLGTKNQSILFGGVPAKIDRAKFCNVGATVSQSRELNNLLKIKYSQIAYDLLGRFLQPWQKVGDSIFKLTEIAEDWRMNRTCWTSGIINKNSPHNFHRDINNRSNIYSAMYTMKNNMSGGYLVFPEYKVAFKVSNRSLIFFMGKDLIHGVSPMSIKQGGYRYSIVFYTMEDMKLCGSYKEEMSKLAL